MRFSRASQEKYGEIFLEDGFYISLLELLLLVDSRDCFLMLSTHEDGILKESRSVHTYLQELLPDDIQLANERSPDTANENTWHVLYCMADFSSANHSQLNHFVPLFHKNMLGQQRFQLAGRRYDQQIGDRIADAHLEVNRIMQTDEDDTSNASLEGLLDQIACLEREKQTFDKLREQGLIAEQVAGDGNCGLRAAATLETCLPRLLDDQDVTAADYEADMKEAVAELREATWQHKDRNA